MLRYVLLAVIAESGPLHGYALMKAFAARSGIRLSVGNVYRELQRLRTDKHIEPVDNPGDADPRRVPYVITDAGRAALASWFSAPAQSFLREPVDPLYCRLALLASGKATHAVNFLNDLEAELSQQRRRTERRREMVRDASPLLQILIGRRARHLIADMEMIAEMRAAFPGQVAHPDRRPPRRDRKGQKPEARRMVASRVGH
jgi:DNA-binding PadR family transcriptional regulator